MRYIFESSGDAKIDKIIKQFDSQIRHEIKEYKDSKLCPSYFNKQLFLMNRTMSYDDWKNIRTPEHRRLCIELRGRSAYDELKYKYQCVHDYNNP